MFSPFQPIMHQTQTTTTTTAVPETTFCDLVLNTRKQATNQTASRGKYKGEISSDLPQPAVIYARAIPTKAGGPTIRTRMNKRIWNPAAMAT